MSKCDLSIELDRPDQHYKTGDTVSCTVTVSVDKTVNCDGLTVTNLWQTHGKGNRDSATLTSEELFQGEWQPGEYSYSFSFEIKEGPLTYRGHYINIDRYVKVRADIPWAIDPKTEIEYIVEKGSQPLESNLSSLKPSNLNQHYKQTEFIKKLETVINNPLRFVNYGIALSLIPLIIGGFLLYLFFFTDSGSGDPIFGFILLAIGLFAAAKLIMIKILHGKIGHVIFEATPSSVRATDEIDIKFEFTPNVDIDVNNITFNLIGKESATSGSGTNRRTVVHQFHSTEQELHRKGIIMRDMPVMERARIQIPIDVPPSFSASNNRIKWAIQAKMDIDNSPDWNKEAPIEILI